MEIVKRRDDMKGFVVLLRRWVVERTLFWFGQNRRLADDFENLAETPATFVTLASIAQHCRAAGFEETSDEKPSENLKNNVQPGRVIPGDGGLDHPSPALRRDKGKAVKDELDDQRRDYHSAVQDNE
jgi:hypothetical protein